MDYNPNQPLVYDPAKMSQSAFLSASMLCALFACTCSSCLIFGSMFFGGMSILFAVLSKGKSLKMHIIGIVAIILSVGSLIFSTITTGVSTYIFISDPALRQETYDEYEKMTGVSFEEEYEAITGNSLEEDIAKINELFQ